MGKVYSQNNYSTEITSPITEASGTISFTVLTAPTYSKGFCWIGRASNPEIGYFTRVGNTLTIAGPTRAGNLSTHAVGTEIRIAHGAEVLNRLENLAETTFSYEILDDLTINVFGGPYTLDGTFATADDSEIEVDDNTTTYVYLRYADDVLTSSSASGILANINDNTHDEYGMLVLTISAVNGSIVSVTENRPRNFVSRNSLADGIIQTTPELVTSYISTLASDTIDVGVTLAIHNPGDLVDKEVTLEDLFTHAQDEGYIEPGYVGAVHSQVSPASTWTVTHNLNSTDVDLKFYDTNTPANIIEPDTVDFYANYVTVTWAGNSVAGKCIVGAPSGTNVANTGSVLELTAGEALNAADYVRMGISGRDAGMNNSFIPASVTTYDTVSSTKFLYQTFKALKADLTKVQVYAKKQTGGDTTALTIEIFATTTQVISGHTYNVPTGAALGTATIAHGSISTSPAYVSGTLSVAIDNLVPGDYYAIKITGVGAQSVDIGYSDDEIDYDTSGFQYVSSLVPISGDYAFKAQAADLEAEVTTKVYQTSAYESETGIYIGVNKLAVAKDGTARVDTHIAATLSGLTPGTRYYLSDLPGTIDDIAGTNSFEAGVAVSSTTIIIR